MHVKILKSIKMNLKRLIILSTIMMVFLSCAVKEKPEFIKVENIKVLESTSTYVTLTADALFLNPNDIGGELKTDGIKVLVNDNEMARCPCEKCVVKTMCQEMCVSYSVYTDLVRGDTTYKEYSKWKGK